MLVHSPVNSIASLVKHSIQNEDYRKFPTLNYSTSRKPQEAVAQLRQNQAKIDQLKKAKAQLTDPDPQQGDKENCRTMLRIKMLSESICLKVAQIN